MRRESERRQAALPGVDTELFAQLPDERRFRRLTWLDLTARRTCPIMKIRVSLDHIHGKLRAFERCNLHGTWEGQAEIEVTD